MLTAGIDIGAKTVKLVVLEDSLRIAARALVQAGTETAAALDRAWSLVEQEAGITKDRVERMVATGAGRGETRGAAKSVTEVGAAARGAVFLEPQVRTIIDAGAEGVRAVRVNPQGRVVDFALNERCAAGAGAFTEAVARALEVGLEELGPLSLKSTRKVNINAQCVVFAESELVSLVHAQVPKEDMIRAVHAALAERTGSLVRRVGLQEKVMLMGGLARNQGYLACLEEELGAPVLTPEHPEHAAALGAALIAAQDQAVASGTGA